MDALSELHPAAQVAVVVMIGLFCITWIRNAF